MGVAAVKLKLLTKWLLIYPFKMVADLLSKMVTVCLRQALLALYSYIQTFKIPSKSFDAQRAPK